ncbi:PilX N-terminal domain-containing pilus assembly protein [Planctomycetota bacterium]
MINRTCRQGIVLIVVLGVLALMSVLAITFVKMTQLERTISQNYVDQTRAMLLAESGIEYAVARLSQFQGGVLRPEEMDALGCEEDKPAFHLPSPNEKYSGIVSSTYTNGGDKFKLKVEDESGKLNLNDTDGLWNLDTDPDPDDPETDIAPGRLRKIVEELGNILFAAPKGAVISSLLFDARDNLPGGRFSNLRQIKDLLVPEVLNGSQFGEFAKHVTLYSWQDSNTIRPTHKWNITVPEGMRPIPEYAERDVYLFSDWQTKGFELESRCPININTASEELLKALIAPVRGWYLREGPPEFLSNWHYGEYYAPTRACYYQYHYGDETNNHFRNGWHQFSGYPREDGHWKDARFGEAHQTSDLMEIDNGSFLEEFINQLYQQIHGDPSAGLAANPIETWEEFEFVVADLLAELLPEDHDYWEESWEDWDPGPGGYDELRADWGYFAAEIDYPYWSKYGRKILLDCLLANFNPNSQLNDFNPDRHIFRMVDKAQLTQYTTEFCFEPTGYFQIKSLGQVTQVDGRILASRKIHTVIKLFEMFRISTQSQFMKGLKAGSNESDLLQYCTHSPFGDNPWGASITSYPEPLLENAAGDYIPNSVYEGQLMLSTYQSPLSQHGGADFQISFNGSLAPPGVGIWLKTSPSIFTTNNGVTVQGEFSYLGPRNEPTNHQLTYAEGSTPDTTLPGVLFPDGALSDAGRALGFTGSFFGDQSIQGRRGALQFWVKPNFDTQAGGRMRKLFSFMGVRFNDTIVSNAGRNRIFTLWFLPSLVRWTHEEKFNYNGSFFYYGERLRPCPPRTLAFGWSAGLGSAKLSIVGELTPTAVSSLPGRAAGGEETHHTYHFDPHQWTHIAFRWNLLVEDPDFLMNIALFANGKRPAQVDGLSQACQHSSYAHGGTPSPDTVVAPYNDDNGPVYARFGECTHYPFQNFVADSTFDEIVSYQLPGNMGLDAQYIYTQVGRYVNTENLTDTAVYLSPAWDPIKELKLGHRETLTLRSVSWTEYWPDYNERRDYYNNPAGEQENPPLLPRNVNDDPIGFDPAMPGDAPDDPLADILGWDQAYDPVSIDIAHLDAGGNESWLADSNDNGDIYDDIANTLTYAGGSRVMLTDSGGMPLQFRHGDSFKFRVYFNVDDNQILYESPVFDDITFTFCTGKPKILRWQVLMND